MRLNFVICRNSCVLFLLSIRAAFESFFLAIHYWQRPFNSAQELYENTWSPNDELTFWVDLIAIIFVFFGLIMEVINRSKTVETVFLIAFLILFAAFVFYVSRFANRARKAADADKCARILPFDENGNSNEDESGDDRDDTSSKE